MSSYLRAVLMCCLLGLVLSSFAQKKKPRPTLKNTPKQETEIDSAWTTMFVPNIAPGKIGAVGLTVDHPFNATEALYKIFPGYHYPRYKDHTWAVWRSSYYPSKKFDDDGYEVPHMFPGKRRNLTCVNTISRFTDDSGRQHIYISFESNELGPLDVLYCGRFAGADISLAHFIRNGDKWELAHFTMALACHGSYHHANPTDTIKLGTDNYGCIIYSGGYNPGGPSYGHMHIYGLADGQFREMLTLYNATRGMRMYGTEWATKINRKASGAKFDDFKLITSGDFNRAAFDTNNKYVSVYDTAIDVPDEVYPNTFGADSFLFRITRTYHFENNKYKMISNKKHIYAAQPRR